MAVPNFDHTHSKISETNLSFLEFAPACKKITSFHPFILEVQSILESHDKNGHTHFWPCLSQTFSDQLLIYVNLYQNAKKSGYFNDLFWIYGWLKNPAGTEGII